METMTRSEIGNTLIEVLLALAISVLVGSALFSIYCSYSKIYTEQTAYADAQYSARSSLQQISRDVRGASSQEILANGTQLRLGMRSGEIITYYLYNQQIYRESISVQGTVRIPVSEHIKTILFSGDISMVVIELEVAVGSKSYFITTGVKSRLVTSSRLERPCLDSDHGSDGLLLGVCAQADRLDEGERWIG